MQWEIEGDTGMELISKDEFGEVLIIVKTGGSHWKFSFPTYGGTGKVRVGDGCDYNPIHMIESMFYQVSDGVDVPIDVRLDPTETSYNLGEDWE